MNVYEAVGLGWIIFTSFLATAGILYFAYLGVKVAIRKHQEASDSEVPVEVKEMFKVAR